MRLNLILAVAAAVLAVPTALTIAGSRVQFTDYQDIPKLFEGFTPERVAFVVLSKPKVDATKKDDKATPKPEPAEKPEREQLVLMKEEGKDGKWVLGPGSELAGVPIRANRVDTDVLEHLKAIRADPKAIIEPPAKSLKPDELDKWLAERDLTEDTGLLVQCLDANKAVVAELIVGKDLSGGKWGEDTVRGRFVRAKDSKVAVAYEVDYWNLTVDKNDWVDTKVHQFDMAKLKAFSLRNPKGSVEFEKENDAGSKWKAKQTPEGLGAVREQEVANLAQRFSFLNAVRFDRPLKPISKSELAQMGIAPGDIEVSATVKEGDKDTDLKVYTVWMGKKIADKNEHYARSNHSDFLFAIGDWDVTPYEKDPKDFFDPAPGTAAPKDGGAEHEDKKPLETAGNKEASHGAAGKDGDASKPSSKQSEPKEGGDGAKERKTESESHPGGDEGGRLPAEKPPAGGEKRDEKHS